MKTRPRILCLLAALMLLAVWPARAETRLMLATDLHYIDPVYVESAHRLSESAAYGDGKMPHYSADWLEALVQEAIWQQPDALILAGDQTYNGEVLSHKAVSEAMDRVRDAGIAVYAIPGNHDINNDNAVYYRQDGYDATHSLTLERYDKYYARFGPEQSFSRDAASKSYAVALTDTLWLLMLDAGIYEPSAEPFGLIEASTQTWLTDLLERARARDTTVITVTHQSMLPHSERVTGGYMIINWESVSDLLIEYGVRLNLSGHIHIQHIAEKGSLHDVSTAALSASPHNYGLVTIEEDGGIRYEVQTLRDDFLPEGRTAESRAFFHQVSRDKALAGLYDSALSQADRERMADFAATVNAHYYAGKLAAARAELLGEDALALWLSMPEDAFWAGYLREMMAEDVADMSTLYLPSPGRTR
ncbi:metallophosphoesterase [Eubacteriales bacterium OttesenSCG-928-A19]|nr:metallophosphoesterase [Eubacteriales bacterium OttesenSCG-928-A19]